MALIRNIPGIRPGQQFSQEAQPFGALARRITARLVLQRAFLDALHIDPTMSECGLFRTISQDNAMILKEEYGE